MMRLPAILGLLIGLALAPPAVLAQGCGQSNPNCIVPTAPPGTSNNQAASTAFVQQALNSVKSGANGCAAAVGNNSNDDTAAIQCQINYMNATFSGGAVYFPCGTYHTTSTLTVPGAVVLQGEQRTCAIISVGNNDVEVLNFTGGSNTYGGMNNIWIVGDNAGGSLTKNAVVVSTNTPIVFYNCMIWGGNFALQEDGDDGSISDCFIMGTGTSGGGIISTGANWYNRVKLDTIGFTVSVAYQQNTFSAIQENHFTASDFSGSLTNSIIISDADSNAITTITNSVFSSPISITGGRYTMFTGDEFGGAVASGVNLSIVGSYGLTALTMTGAGARSCSGNFNIAC